MTALISGGGANVGGDMGNINDILNQERGNTPELVYKLPDDYDPRKEVEDILAKKGIFLKEGISKLSGLNRGLLKQDINKLPKYASADTGVVTDAGGNSLGFESEEGEGYEKTLFYEAKEVKLPKEAEKIVLGTGEGAGEFYIWQNKKGQFVIMKGYKYALEGTDFVQNIVEYKGKYYSIKTIEENDNLEWGIMEIKENPFKPLMNYEEFPDKEIVESFMLGDMEFQLYISNKSKKTHKRYKRMWRNVIKQVIKGKGDEGNKAVADFLIKVSPNMVLQWGKKEEYKYLSLVCEDASLDRENASLDRENASLDRENASLDREIRRNKKDLERLKLISNISG